MRGLSVVAALSLLAIAGCRAAPGLSDQVSQPLSPSHPRRQTPRSSLRPVTRKFPTRPVRSDRQPAESPIRLVSGSETALPARPSLTLAAAIRTALERNPNLVTQREAESVSLAAYDVARTYLFNPQYQGQIIPTPRARNGETGSTDNQHVIVQTFELAGQQRHRTAGGVASLNQVRWTIQQVELLTVAGTERLFLTALYQRDVRDLERSVARLNVELDGVLARRFQAGQATAADVAMARLQSRAAERRADLAETTYRAAVLARRYANCSTPWPPMLMPVRPIPGGRTSHCSAIHGTT